MSSPEPGVVDGQVKAEAKRQIAEAMKVGMKEQAAKEQFEAKTGLPAGGLKMFETISESTPSPTRLYGRVAER